MLPGAGVDRNRRVHFVDHVAEGLHLRADVRQVIERLVRDVEHGLVLPALRLQVFPESLQTRLVGLFEFRSQLTSVHSVKRWLALVRLFPEFGGRRVPPAEQIELPRHVGHGQLEFVKVAGGCLIKLNKIRHYTPVAVLESRRGANRVRTESSLGQEIDELPILVVQRAAPQFRAGAEAYIVDRCQVVLVRQCKIPHVYLKCLLLYYLSAGYQADLSPIVAWWCLLVGAD